MALTTAQQASELDKKAQGKSSTNTTRDFFEEPYNGRAAVFANQIWTESTLIPSTAPSLAADAISGVVQYKVDLVLAAVAGTTNSFYHASLVDCIPFNFGDGTYNYTLKDSTSAAIAFGQGDWRVDITTGVLTFYSTVPSNMPPKITFYKYVGDKADNTSFGGGGGGSVSIDTITTTDTVANGTTLALASAASASYTITLPSSATATGPLVLKRTDANIQYVITWAAIGGETVNGGASLLTHTQNESWSLVPNGTNWVVEFHDTVCPEFDVGAMVVSSSSHYSFTVVAVSITAGTTYSSNGNLFVVSTTSAASITLLCYGNGSPGAAPGTLVYVSGPTAGDRAFSAVSTAGAPAKGSTGSPGYEKFIVTRDGAYANFRYDLKAAVGTQGTGDYALWFNAAVRANVTNVNVLTTVISTTITGAIIQSIIGSGFLSSSVGSDFHAIIGHSYFFRGILQGNGSYSASTGGNLASATSISINGRYRVVDWAP